jgi:hypothetical protein
VSGINPQQLSFHFLVFVARLVKEGIPRVVAAAFGSSNATASDSAGVYHPGLFSQFSMWQQTLLTDLAVFFNVTGKLPLIPQLSSVVNNGTEMLASTLLPDPSVSNLIMNATEPQLLTPEILNTTRLQFDSLIADPSNIMFQLSPSFNATSFTALKTFHGEYNIEGLAL